MEASERKVTPIRDELAYRQPPHNYEAEQALLGAILVNNQAFERVNEFLRPEHFHDPVHGRLYAALANLIERGQIANPVTLKAQFDQDPGLTDAGGAQYLVTQPLNGESATLAGVEFALQNHLRFLPSPFNGLGVYANYTYTDSTAHFPGRTSAATLPGQSKHVGNVAASYEKGGFDGRVSVNFHGSYIDTVGADATQDRFYDTNSQLDVTLMQQVARNTRVYVNLLNLNDALLRYYQGVPDRVQQEEHYHWWLEFGLKVGF